MSDGEQGCVERAVRCVALDAMGVLYRVADDVAELLIPFIRERGGTAEVERIAQCYIAASLGRMDPDRFWNEVGLDSDLEDEYLARHRLTEGASEFLVWAKARRLRVWFLSNDVSRWSLKLRRRFGLDELVEGWVISGDVGIRKPDAGIYEAFLKSSEYPADQILFVDDREKNVQAARCLGIRSLLFGGDACTTDCECVRSFGDLRQILAKRG